MKKEDLRVGGIYKDDNAVPTFRKVVFFDDKTVFYYYGATKKQANNGAFSSSMLVESFIIVSEEVKEKKRYWIFDVKIPNGLIIKPHFYMDEDGIGTNGELCYNKHNLIKKHENEFVEA